MTRTPALELPYDVWLHITSYLSLEEVKALYAVNSALLGIALDERYRNGFVGPLTHRGTKRAFARLIDPFVARRVRAFLFRPGDLCKLLQESSSKQYERKLVHAFSEMRISLSGSSPQARNPRTFTHPNALRMYHPPPAPSQPLPASTAQKRTLAVMRGMSALAELHVEISGKDHWYFAEANSSSNDSSTKAQGPVPALFAAGWSAFGASLRVLELRVPLEDLACVLPASGTVLPCLERVTLGVVRASLTTDEASVLHTVVLPFLQTHAGTLRALALDVQEHTNMSPFLSALAHPSTARMRRLQLTSFALTQPFVSTDQTDFAGLQAFLLAHRASLTSLSLKMNSTFTHYPAPEVFFAHRSFQLPLPALQHLSIHLAHFPVRYAGGMIPYVHQFAATLVGLTLQGQFWPYDRVLALLEGFGADSRLRELQMAVATFSPALISALADNLPSLETLDLDFKDVIPTGYLPGGRNPMFCAELSQLSFRHWKLQKLNIKPLNLIGSVRKMCKAVLVDALPSVTSFCGRERDEYVSTPDFI